MTPEDFREVLDTLQVSPGDFARVCGAAIRMGQRWASGAAPIPHGVAAMARLAQAQADRMAWAEMAQLLRAEANRLDAAAASKTGEAPR